MIRLLSYLIPTRPWPGQRGRKLTVVGVYVAFVIALSYRPGHPWSGLIGGAEAIGVVVLLAYICVILAQYRRAAKQLKENP
jgi:hypothetical protein